MSNVECRRKVFYLFKTCNPQPATLTPYMKLNGTSNRRILKIPPAPFRKGGVIGGIATLGLFYKKSKINLHRAPNALRRMPLRNLYETIFPKFLF
jgi:hypothetical protein